MRCFLEKFTQLAKILHDRRSGRLWQISSLPKCGKRAKNPLFSKKKQSVFCYRIPDFVNDRLPVTALALAARIHFGLCALRAVWITLSYCSRKSFCKFYNSRCQWGLQIGCWLSHLTTFTVTFSWRLRLDWFPNYVDFSDLWTFLTGQRSQRF